MPCRLPGRCIAISAAAVLILGGAGRSSADEFLLSNGGRIEGQWLNRDEQPLHQYLVLTPSGVKVSLPVQKVDRTIRDSAARKEYEAKAPLTGPSVDEQWQLAEWCRQNHLFDERKVHLRQIIAQYPNHPQARRALGYQFLNGEWITQSDFRRSEGYEYYKGRWRTPQEIEILESRGRMEQAQKDWLVKLRRFRKDLDDPTKAKPAHESLLAIKDSVAVGPLAAMMVRERSRRVKLLYADMLAQMNTSESIAVLIERTLSDPDIEVYYYCLDRLLELNPPHLALPYINALKDQYNERINRAAAALGRIDDPSAVSPLIDALITTHTHVLPRKPGTGPNSTTTGFSDDGTTFKQNEAPEVLVVHVQNQHVLDALTRLTGANFGYDQKGWRIWHAQELKAQQARIAELGARN